MTQTAPQDYVNQLQVCLELANDVASHPQAQQAFTGLCNRLQNDNPLAVELITLLWHELLSAHRSAQFWQQLSDMEKDMADKVAASHLQLRQNYLRLVQEQ